MNTNCKLNTYALSAAIVFALSACGGGGMVRSTPAAPVAPPPAMPISTCPSQPTSDCVITRPGNQGNVFWHHNVSSNFALIKQGTHYIDIASGDYRFAGGTRIEEGGLYIGEGVSFQSSVEVLPDAWLVIAGVLNGSVRTRGGAGSGGSLTVSGTLRGNVHNEGVTYVPLHNPQITSTRPVNRIEGDFRQSNGGTLGFSLPYLDYFTPLTITGRADLAGMMSMSRYVDWDLGPYPLPASALTLHLIHAGGGVFGSFDRWTSPGLFIEGGIRYGSNDVWFDLTRVSVLSGATANALGNGVTLASAANIDRALAAAGSFTGQTSASQQAFLSSAGKLLWMGDAAQATRAIDSLSGAIHADALRSTSDAASARTALGAHLDRVVPGDRLGAWMHEDGNSVTSGVDQWLGPHLLAGVHASQGASADAASASATDLGSGGYLRWFGEDGWYSGVDAGVTHRDQAVGRTIDFGSAGRWHARSRRSMDAASFSVEAGRRLSVAGGNLTPFIGVGASTVHAAASSEEGSSGFELQLADAQLRGSRASSGLRFARHWQWGDARWLQLNAATGIDQSHWNGQQQAAFLGVPDTWFDLPASSAGRQRWASLGLQGGWGRGWTWNAARSTGRAFGSDQAWQLSLRRKW